MCIRDSCIPKSKLYNIRDNGACVTASADPEISDFFLTGYKYMGEDYHARDYFAESEDFDLTFIRSIKEVSQPYQNPLEVLL